MLSKSASSISSSGSSTALAAAQLFDQGYTRLYDLGGLNGWPYGMEYGLL